jgi:hypothetical protein
VHTAEASPSVLMGFSYWQISLPVEVEKGEIKEFPLYDLTPTVVLLAIPESFNNPENASAVSN